MVKQPLMHRLLYQQGVKYEEELHSSWDGCERKDWNVCRKDTWSWIPMFFVVVNVVDENHER